MEVHPVVSVRAAVEDVHHGHGEHPRPLAAKVAPQRHPLLGRGRVRVGKRDAEDRVRAEPRLVRGSVESDQPLVEARLVGGVEAADGVRDLVVDVRYGTRYALAREALSAVAQLGRLELAGRSAGRDRRVAVCARAQTHLDLHGRIATAVQNLARVDCLDLAQRYPVADVEVEVLAL